MQHLSNRILMPPRVVAHTVIGLAAISVALVGHRRALQESRDGSHSAIRRRDRSCGKFSSSWSPPVPRAQWQA